MGLVKMITAVSLLFTQQPRPTVFIPTSEVVRVAQIIAQDEGYDIRKKSIYFDLLQTRDGKPLLDGYTSIGFYIDAQPRNSISINNETGQTIDMFSCEVFDYPDLQSFQRGMVGLTKVRFKSPQELASDAGCDVPKVLRRPTPLLRK